MTVALGTTKTVSCVTVTVCMLTCVIVTVCRLRVEMLASHVSIMCTTYVFPSKSEVVEMGPSRTE